MSENLRSRRRRELDKIVERFRGYDANDWGGLDKLLKVMEEMKPLEAAYVAVEMGFEFQERLELEI